MFAYVGLCHSGVGGTDRRMPIIKLAVPVACTVSRSTQWAVQPHNFEKDCMVVVVQLGSLSISVGPM